jgi:maltose alpha-D-glucosyltransferase/alpha-amylase
MPGVPKIYYGDEIGMQGVLGLPSKEGGYERTQSRTPMQWTRERNAGFSTGKAEDLYLPVEPDLGTRTVADQDADPESLLNHVRRLITLRRAHPALCNRSEFELLYAQPGSYPLVYLRRGDGETVVVAVNPAARPVDICFPAFDGASGTVTTLYGVENGLMHEDGGWRVRLPGISAGVYQVSL